MIRPDLLLWALASVALLFAIPTATFGADKNMADEHLLDVIRTTNDDLKREVLPNGMVLLVKEDHSAPVASVQIWIGTGSIHEQKYIGGGLSHYVEHMIFKGTKRRAVGEVTSDITDAGGRINAYTSKDRTVIYTDIPSEHWRTGVDVLSDAVMNATFPRGGMGARIAGHSQ